jgi:hypothetical protein
MSDKFDPSSLKSFFKACPPGKFKFPKLKKRGEESDPEEEEKKTSPEYAITALLKLLNSISDPKTRREVMEILNMTVACSEPGEAGLLFRALMIEHGYEDILNRVIDEEKHNVTALVVAATEAIRGTRYETMLNSECVNIEDLYEKNPNLAMDMGALDEVGDIIAVSAHNIFEAERGAEMMKLIGDRAKKFEKEHLGQDGDYTKNLASMANLFGCGILLNAISSVFEQLGCSPEITKKLNEFSELFGKLVNKAFKVFRDIKKANREELEKKIAETNEMAKLYANARLKECGITGGLNEAMKVVKNNKSDIKFSFWTRELEQNAADMNAINMQDIAVVAALGTQPQKEVASDGIQHVFASSELKHRDKMISLDKRDYTDSENVVGSVLETAFKPPIPITPKGGIGR